jgi:hypothetical protein
LVSSGAHGRHDPEGHALPGAHGRCDPRYRPPSMPGPGAGGTSPVFPRVSAGRATAFRCSDPGGAPLFQFQAKVLSGGATTIHRGKRTDHPLVELRHLPLPPPGPAYAGLRPSSPGQPAIVRINVGLAVWFALQRHEKAPPKRGSIDVALEGTRATHHEYHGDGSVSVRCPTSARLPQLGPALNAPHCRRGFPVWPRHRGQRSIGDRGAVPVMASPRTGVGQGVGGRTTSRSRIHLIAPYSGPL